MNQKRISRLLIAAGALAGVGVLALAGVFAPALARETDEYFRGLGFSYVTADLRGYRMGSMNRDLEKNA